MERNLGGLYRVRNAESGLMLPFRAVTGAGGLEHFQEKSTDTKVASHITANIGKESA